MEASLWELVITGTHQLGIKLGANLLFHTVMLQSSGPCAHGSWTSQIWERMGSFERRQLDKNIGYSKNQFTTNLHTHTHTRPNKHLPIVTFMYTNSKSLSLFRFVTHEVGCMKNDLSVTFDVARQKKKKEKKGMHELMNDWMDAHICW